MSDRPGDGPFDPEVAATFLTPPHDWGSELRCFLRDPDGHLIELSQAL